MLALRRWPNINPALGQRLVFAGIRELFVRYQLDLLSMLDVREFKCNRELFTPQKWPTIIVNKRDKAGEGL